MDLYTFTAQLILIITPIFLGKDIIWSIYGLLADNWCKMDLADNTAKEIYRNEDLC